MINILKKIKLFFESEKFILKNILRIQDIEGNGHTLLYFVSNKNNTKVQITPNIVTTGVVEKLDMAYGMPECYKYCKPIKENQKFPPTP